MERYVFHLAAALGEMGNEVDLVSGAHDASTPRFERAGRVRIHRFPAYRSPWRAQAALIRLAPRFARADVIHISDTQMLEYYLRMIGWLVPSDRLFLTRHGMTCHYPVPAEEKRRAARGQRWVRAVAHDGAFIRKWLEVDCDALPPQGLSPTVAELEAESTFKDIGVDVAKVSRAVFVGRLARDSCIDVYLDAMRCLRSDGQLDLSLDVYGDGSERDRLEKRVATEGLAVRFHGRQPNAQSKLHGACFAFVSGRMSMQEALARRCIVLAAWQDPLKYDYVAGEYFSEHIEACGSGGQVAERIRFYTDHPAARQRRVESGLRFAAGLSWSRTAEVYLAFWQRGLGGRDRGLSWRARCGWSRRLSGEARARERLSNPGDVGAVQPIPAG